MERQLSLIGVVPEAHAAALVAAMRLPDAPDVTLHAFGSIAVLAETPEAPRRLALLRRDRAGLLRGLHRLQRRLEIGAQSGPFLAFDPGAAACPAADLPRLLAASAAALEAALQRDGRRHQWDVVLRWQPEAILAACRASFAGITHRAGLAAAVAAALDAAREERRAALRTALAPHVIALAETSPVEGDAETGATVLVPAGGEAAIEAALGQMPAALTQGMSAELRGPLPAFAFAPLRVTELEAAAVEAAWRTLGLPDRLGAEELTRHWRALAMDLHPDRAGPAADVDRLDEAGRAYKLIRGLAAEVPAGALDLATLCGLGGRRLAIPAGAA